MKILLVEDKTRMADALAQLLKKQNYDVDDYLAKPFDTNELLARVRVLCSPFYISTFYSVAVSDGEM